MGSSLRGKRLRIFRPDISRLLYIAPSLSLDRDVSVEFTVPRRIEHDGGRLQRGLTVPVHGPNSELGILSLYSDLSDKEFLRVTETTQYDIHLIAHYIHDAVQNKLRHESLIPMPIALTNRELEILQWTVDGKTAWEVGSILNIAERTVNFHVQNVMEKFGVHNKTQAAAKAIGMGLLDI